MSTTLDDRDCAALIAVVDGLDTDEARRMATRAEHDQELRALVARQQRVAAARGEAVAAERAPLALREATSDPGAGGRGAGASARRRRRALPGLQREVPMARRRRARGPHRRPPHCSVWPPGSPDLRP